MNVEEAYLELKLKNARESFSDKLLLQLATDEVIEIRCEVASNLNTQDTF